MTDKFNLDEWVDPLRIQDRHFEPTTSLRDTLAGRSVFLACGGPSARELPLVQLLRRGCWTMAVNNMAGWENLRPQAFVCSDPPEKFADAVWLDPAIMKIIPDPKLTGGRGRSGIRTRNDEGELVFLNRKKKHGRRMERVRVRDCPNVWGFERRSWMEIDDTFFTDTAAAWGNHAAGVLRTGQPKTVCTMLLGMRLLRYLGARRVFLIGVDFNMKAGVGNLNNYAFGESRDQGAIDSNNRQFKIVNDWLCKLQTDGIFEKFGIEFFNCNPNSGLRAFPHVSFGDAVKAATEGIEAKPNLLGWYVKESDKKKK